MPGNSTKTSIDKTSIVVASITVVGSIVVAWITAYATTANKASSAVGEAVVGEDHRLGKLEKRASELEGRVDLAISSLDTAKTDFGFHMTKQTSLSIDAEGTKKFDIALGQYPVYGGDFNLFVRAFSPNSYGVFKKVIFVAASRPLPETISSKESYRFVPLEFFGDLYTGGRNFQVEEVLFECEESGKNPRLIVTVKNLSKQKLEGDLIANGFVLN